jgi:Ca-activated chloride channel family protein
MNITSEADKKDSLSKMPDIPPPTPRRSPLMSGTYKLNSAPNVKPANNSTTMVMAMAKPWTKGAKKTFALLTVSASIIGAFSTIGGFAHSVAPQQLAPQHTALMPMGPLAIGNMSNGMPMPATVPTDPDSLDTPMSALNSLGQPLGHCPLAHTTMDAKLSGYVARVNVTQVFTNPYTEKIEAVYNFPLSDESAVDGMTIKIGERTIKGDIKTSVEAQHIYDQAKNVGHAAALLDQQRTNIFTQHVANIEPGKSIIVQISYVELLKFEDGRYTFTMPTTIGSRFYPSGPVYTSTDASLTLEKTLSGNVSPGTQDGANLSINVDVDAGLPIKNVSSKLFPIMVDKQSPSHCLVTLRKSVNVPNKDFILTYELDKAQSIKSGYLAYRNDKAKDKDGYATFMLLPPAKVTSANAAPKEMIFLVDCSGSQTGPPLEKAKETLHYIVDHMNPNDTFQILTFNFEVTTLADQPISAGRAEKLRAHDFINNLTAQGGTWMAPAVERVLKQTASNDKDLQRLRIVTFMTDGFVGNDLEIMSLIQNHRQDSRWFTFGTGNSVNHKLIDNVARLGGGEADYVLLNSTAEEVGKKFYSRIASPALTNVTLKSEGLDLYDVYPGAVSDVWANKPLYFTARYKSAGHGKVVLKGFANGRPYEQALDVTLPKQDTTNSAIEKVWARQKINSLTDTDLPGLSNGQMEPLTQIAITKLALDHKLMSDFTSFVAVDTAFTEGGVIRTVPVSNIQPEGSELSTPYNYGSVPAASVQSVSTAVPLPRFQYVPAATYYSGGPVLQGATNGTIAPQGADATVIQGVNTSGTVRVNNLANMEAVLNIMVNGMEILGIAWGGSTMVIGIRRMRRDGQRGLNKVLLGALVVMSGLAAPGAINWLVATARDAGIFN